MSIRRSPRLQANQPPSNDGAFHFDKIFNAMPSTVTAHTNMNITTPAATLDDNSLQLIADGAEIIGEHCDDQMAKAYDFGTRQGRERWKYTFLAALVADVKLNQGRMTITVLKMLPIPLPAWLIQMIMGVFIRLANKFF